MNALDRKRARRDTGTWREKARPVIPPPHVLDPDKWPCDLCGHPHYPGKRCGANGCECRA